MIIKIVSFAIGAAYHKAMERLEKSLSGQCYELTKSHVIKDWKSCVVEKPQFILNALENSYCDGVLWTDADSELVSKPDWNVFQGVDMGAVRWRRSPQHEEEILTGTMFWAKSDRAIELCREWAYLTPSYREHFTPEQASLKEILGREESKAYKVKALPVEWCYIADDHAEEFPNVHPIFKHYQMSRQERARAI